MSKASKVGQVTYIQRSGVYMPAIMCDMGDLYQEYDGDASSPTNIAPDFTTMKPTLSFMVTSSRVAEGLVNPSAMKWYFNDVLLTFSGNVSTNTFAGETGHFKFIPLQVGTTDYYGLQIVKNLVKASDGASCTIKGVATVTVGNTADDVQFVYGIPISKGIGNQKVVTIAAGDNKYFALREKGDSCILRAVTREGSGEVTSGLTYKWFRMVSAAWQELSGKTSQTLTVTADMVDTTAMFKVEVSKGGQLIGLDTQTVIDLSDPYDMITNPDPADETINSDDPDTAKVTYTPIVVKRGTTTKAVDTQFYFTFMDNAGNILNPATATTAAASGSCTKAMCEQCGGNVPWTIESVS